MQSYDLSSRKEWRPIMIAQPKEAWRSISYFMLSDRGEAEAIPVARRAGKSFFTVDVRYTEDPALFNNRCPDGGSRCDCPETLVIWKFANGRELFRLD